jgi:hypothetical protein
LYDFRSPRTSLAFTSYMPPVSILSERQGQARLSRLRRR